MKIIVKNGKPVVVNGRLLNQTGNSAPISKPNKLLTSGGSYMTLNGKVLYRNRASGASGGTMSGTMMTGTTRRSLNLLKESYFNSTMLIGKPMKRWAAQVMSTADLKKFLVEGKTYTLSYDLEVVGLAKYANVWTQTSGLLLYCSTDSKKNRDAYSGIERRIGATKHVKKTFVCPNLDGVVLLCYTNRYVETSGVVNPADNDTMIFTNLSIVEGSADIGYERPGSLVHASYNGMAVGMYDTLNIDTGEYLQGGATEDMGDLTWYSMTYEGRTIFYAKPTLTKPKNSCEYMTGYYETIQNSISKMEDKQTSGSGGSGDWVWVYDADKTSMTPAQFKESVKGIDLYYRRTTPVTTVETI